jgi:hypothetical protein
VQDNGMGKRALIDAHNCCSLWRVCPSTCEFTYVLSERLHCPADPRERKGCVRYVNRSVFYLNFDRKERLSASRAIPAHTVIEIDPVLLFAQDEYEEHGKHTVLAHYAFKWRGSQMALALGLGITTISS